MRNTNRLLHKRILMQIERALAGRSWAWLSHASGVPASTLSNQVTRPKFTLDVLQRIAVALDRPITFFLQGAEDEIQPAYGVPNSEE